MAADDVTRAAEEEWLRQSREAFAQQRRHREILLTHQMAIERLLVRLLVACSMVVFATLCAAVALIATGTVQPDARLVAPAVAALTTTVGGLVAATWRFASRRALTDLEPIQRGDSIADSASEPDAEA